MRTHAKNRQRGNRYWHEDVHEWLMERMTKNEGLWLNDKNAVLGVPVEPAAEEFRCQQELSEEADG